MLWFSISLVLYLMGYSSLIINTYAEHAKESSSSGFLEISDVLRIMANAVLSPSGLQLLLIGAVAALSSLLLGGFGSMYIVPMMLLLSILNLFVFPFSFIVSASIPSYVSIPLVVFINLLTLLCITTFVRGGG